MSVFVVVVPCGLYVVSTAVVVEVFVVLSDGCVRFGVAKVGIVTSCPPGCPGDDGVGVVRPASGLDPVRGRLEGATEGCSVSVVLVPTKLPVVLSPMARAVPASSCVDGDASSEGCCRPC